MCFYPPGSQPFRPGTFISLHIPTKDRSKAKRDCLFGTRPRPNSSIEKGDLISWLQVLPNDYVAEIGHCSKKHFTHFMHIFLHRPQETRQGFFRLHYNADLSRISLQMDDAAHMLSLWDAAFTRLFVGGGDGFGLRCDYSITGARQRGPTHPFRVFSASLDQGSRQGESGVGSGVVPGVVRVLLNPDLARKYAAVTGDADQRRQFSRMLASITGGSIKSIICRRKLSREMEEIDGGFLYDLYGSHLSPKPADTPQNFHFF
jgi:hypothetical protein